MFELSDLEINKTIHDKLFGKCWHFFYSSKEQMPHQRIDHCAKCEDFFGEYKARHEGNPDYCNSIADAWQIVEKVHQAGAMVSLNGSNETGEWWFVIYPKVGVMIEGFSALTPGRAICVAVLEALNQNLLKAKEEKENG